MKKILDIIRKINFIFDRSDKIKFIGLLGAIALTTMLELIGVVAIMPFINIVMDPGTIEKTGYLNWIYSTFKFQDSDYFIAFLGIVLILIYLIKNGAIMLLYYIQYSFTFSVQKKLSNRMLKCYVGQPYVFHLQNNSANLIRNINSDVVMMFQAIISILGLVTEIAVCIILSIYLLIQDKSIAIGVVVILGMFVLAFANRFKNYLTKIGEEDRVYNASIVRTLQQSFGGIKETKILGREEYFLKQFDFYYTGWTEREKKYRFMQMIPKPIMEAVCISALFGVVVLKLLNGTHSAYFISTLSVFAVAAFRLLPSINRITSSLGSIMFNIPAIDAVYNDLKEVEKLSHINTDNERGIQKLNFKENIKINDLIFKYPDKEENVLENINLEIKKYQSIALVGPSGAGKTTLADIVLGILEPTQGAVLVDGVDIKENKNGWRMNLGYIPQNIYLLDDTIKNNILYGHEVDDEDKLWKAIEEAQLKEFISELEQGLDTIVGENGVCLSGGQRQRIGIARALYNNPEILVLDEATSALDNETEAAVMEAINHLSGNKTLIIIAHRLSTIEKCDVIYEVKDKKVVQKKLN